MDIKEKTDYREMYHAILTKAPSILERLESKNPNCTKQLQELIASPLEYETEQPDSLRPG
jgi:hypothetical protein